MTAMPPNFDPLRFCVTDNVSLSTEERQQWVATAAYYRAESRGFSPGLEDADWHQAEVQIEAQLTHQAHA